MSLCKLGCEAPPPTADLPFPAVRTPLWNLFRCVGGRSSSVPAILEIKNTMHELFTVKKNEKISII